MRTRKATSHQKSAGDEPSCSEVLSHLHSEVEGELDPLRQERLHRHLVHCETCACRRRELLDERLWILEHAVDSPNLSDNFPRKVMARIAEAQRAERRWRFRTWLGRAAATGGGIAAAGILVFMAVRTPDGAPDTEVAAQLASVVDRGGGAPRIATAGKAVGSGGAMIASEARRGHSEDSRRPDDPLVAYEADTESIDDGAHWDLIDLPAEETVAYCPAIDATSDFGTVQQKTRTPTAGDILRVSGLLEPARFPAASARPERPCPPGPAAGFRPAPSDVALLCRQVLGLADVPRELGLHEISEGEGECFEPCVGA